MVDMMKVVASEHGRLLLELLSALEGAGFVAGSQELPGTYAATHRVGSAETVAALRELEQQKRVLESELVPDLATNVTLVWACTRPLPDILRGTTAYITINMAQEALR